MSLIIFSRRINWNWLSVSALHGKTSPGNSYIKIYFYYLYLTTFNQHKKSFYGWTNLACIFTMSHNCAYIILNSSNTNKDSRAYIKISCLNKYLFFVARILQNNYEIEYYIIIYDSTKWHHFQSEFLLLYKADTAIS